MSNKHDMYTVLQLETESEEEQKASLFSEKKQR